WLPGWPRRRSGVMPMVRFGVNLTGSALAGNLRLNADNILIGRFFGPEALGIYSRSFALLLLPVNQINGPLNPIAIPALSRLACRPPEYVRFYRRAVGVLALLALPCPLFCFAAAPAIIALLLGPGWE